jgi:TrmH family RNA methyltransferase
MLAAASLRVSIPMAAGTESLNVAAAGAICMFEALRQRGNPRGDAARK